MNEYIIKEVNKYGSHVLLDVHHVLREVKLEFHDIEPKPQIGEHIVFVDDILDIKKQEGLRFFAFGGDLKDTCGRDVSGTNLDENTEIMILKRNGKKIYLKRLYG